MDPVRFDYDSLTMADLEDFEEATGANLLVLLRSGDEADGYNVNFTAKQLTALMWIVRRQHDPTFTLTDARAMKITDIPSIDVAAPVEV